MKTKIEMAEGIIKKVYGIWPDKRDTRTTQVLKLPDDLLRACYDALVDEGRTEVEGWRTQENWLDAHYFKNDDTLCNLRQYSDSPFKPTRVRSGQKFCRECVKKAPPVDDGWYRFGSKDNPAHYFEKYESLCKWTGTFPEGWLRCENQAAVNNVCPACNARSAAHEQVEDQPARGDEPSTEMVDELAWFTKKYTDQPRSPKTIYNMLLDLAQMINEATGKTYLEGGA